MPNGCYSLCASSCCLLLYSSSFSSKTFEAKLNFGRYKYPNARTADAPFVAKNTKMRMRIAPVGLLSISELTF